MAQDGLPEAKSYEQLQQRPNWETQFLDRLRDCARTTGVLALLRDPVGIAGAGCFKMSESAPEDDRNEEVAARYRANILRVMQQVHYNTTTAESIDLVFFISTTPARASRASRART